MIVDVAECEDIDHAEQGSVEVEMVRAEDTRRAELKYGGGVDRFLERKIRNVSIAQGSKPFDVVEGYRHLH